MKIIEKPIAGIKLYDKNAKLIICEPFKMVTTLYKFIFININRKKFGFANNFKWLVFDKIREVPSEALREIKILVKNSIFKIRFIKFINRVQICRT